MRRQEEADGWTDEMRDGDKGKGKDGKGERRNAQRREGGREWYTWEQRMREED